jgi:hypothetical protein
MTTTDSTAAATAGQDAEAALSPRVQQELAGLEDGLREALIKLQKAYYESTEAFLRRCLNGIEYGVNKQTGNFRRKKAKELCLISPEELFGGLEEWISRLVEVQPYTECSGQLREMEARMPALLIEEQAPERFQLQESDSGPGSFRKITKVKLYRAQQGAYQLLGKLGLKLSPRPWKQQVPLRAMLQLNVAGLLERMLSEQLLNNRTTGRIMQICGTYLSSLTDAGIESQPEESPGLTAFCEALQALLNRLDTLREAGNQRAEALLECQLKQLYRQCSLVDTVELSKKAFTPALVDSRQKRVADKYRSYNEINLRDARLSLEELRLRQELFAFGQSSLKHARQMRESLKMLFMGDQGYGQLIEEAGRIYDELQQTYGISSDARRSDARLISQISTLQKAMQQLMLPEMPASSSDSKSAKEETESTPAIGSQLVGIKPNETLTDDFSSALLFRCNELQEKLSYHQQRSIDEQTGMPVLKEERIELREEVTAYVRGVILRKLSPLPGRIAQECQTLRDDWQELAEMVSINLSSAIDLVEDKDEEKHRVKASELADESLRRGKERLLELVEEVEQAYKRIIDTFDEAVEQNLVFLLDIAKQARYSELKWKSRSLKVGQTALDWKSKIVMYWSRVQDFTMLFRRFSGRKYRHGAEWLQKSTGLGAPQGDAGVIKTDAAQFLAETDRIIARLPLIYRRLYRNDPVEHKRFLIGRSNALGELRKAYESWKTGYHSNFIAIGERGSGKTSILDIGIEQLGLPANIPVIRGKLGHTIFTEAELMLHLCELFSMEADTDTAAFIIQLRQRKDKPVVVWEGFQNLYLRHMGGFQALNAFLLILSQTGQQVFWVISCSRYAWGYLDKVDRVGEYFLYKTYTDELGAEEIKNVIMSRHPISGYELEFIAGDREQSSRSYKKLLNDYAGQQELLSNRYFNELYQVSEGNISIALLYWLRSVQVEGETTIKIMPLADTVKQIGEGLSDEAIFTLAFILMHDDLTPAQHALALHMTEEESKLLLSRLTAKSLLSLADDGRYRLNHLLYRNITRILKNKNILH